ncbi:MULTISPECIES: ATP synthase F1 subunit epsilon [unclassified Siphonobacter]|uniref:ATP synthase F1 subunit epsilon n=1 Tax=unclassified Siphonobacter TaxID=2635712 RepID=UPI000CBC8D3B|nr:MULTISPECIES: ATP synthase F1 subunit epsilon [unclassified Siphonobacter]MDQ1087923.1 F-type H+-transporting ATPase subunit epsilon [Siphonobacter sp. SORGH_AS_1065]MDR6194067.1 F-type H+-transporting ATPase subunit epsilon [Siphonobacter sp. SORGH_AS_0500]PKK36881.1 ATP synthase F1 subunit epsilon [Siphonobacter sp. SORGH_AS_0500]
MFIEIITPDKKVFAGEAVSASFPGTQGSFQILNNHAPLVSTIGKGPVVVETKDGQKTYTVDGGVVEVLNNKILVLAEAIL